MAASVWWFARAPALPLTLMTTDPTLQYLTAGTLAGLGDVVTDLQVRLTCSDAFGLGKLDLRNPVRPPLVVAKPFVKRSRALVTPAVEPLGEAEEQLRMDTALNVALSFPSLEALTLTCFAKSTLDVRRLAGLTRLKRLQLPLMHAVTHLEALATLFPDLEELFLRGVNRLRDITPIATCAQLKRLDVSNTHVSDLAPLAACPSLQTLLCRRLVHPSKRVRTSVYGGRAPRSEQEAARMEPMRQPIHLGRLAGAPCLHTIDASECHVTAVEGLARCPALKSLRLNGCVSSVSLEGLQGTPKLRDISLAGAGVTSLQPLHACAALEIIDVSRTRFLESLEGLEGLRYLRVLTARDSRVRVLGRLATCASLEEVDVSVCPLLEDISGLNGAPVLRHLDMHASTVAVTGSFRDCTELQTVNANYCANLSSLSGFAGAPSLCKLEASDTHVSSLAGLNQCPSLQYLTLQDTQTLCSLAGLEGAPKLRWLHVAGTRIASLEPLRGLPCLEQLNASNCALLTSVEPLRGAPRLASIALRDSVISDAHALSSCPSLTEVFITTRRPPSTGPALARGAAKGHCIAF